MFSLEGKSQIHQKKVEFCQIFSDSGSENKQISCVLLRSAAPCPFRTPGRFCSRNWNLFPDPHVCSSVHGAKLHGSIVNI